MTAKTLFISVLTEDRSVELTGGQQLPAMAASGARAGHLGRALLLRMVNSLWPTDGSRTQINKEPSGRPYLAGTGLSAAPFVSLSHSRGWIACAATEIGPVGIDIEMPRPGRNTDLISEAAFGPLETQRISRTGARGFYRVWTIREAMGKATGEGLRLAADQLDRAHEGPDEGAWEVLSGSVKWSVSHQIIEHSLHAATAVLLPKGTDQVEIRRWPAEHAE